jgi:DNA helicase-2/ATP-dependent DNA helicase PcrA
MQTSELQRAFDEAYAGLNPAQRQAVDTIEGPVMVIAGPGTGKTQILTLRIANILLKTDTKPENILALTFTQSGATAMRERLLRYIGSAAYRVRIDTFHGFAGGLIPQYPDAYPRIIGGRAATEIEKISIIESILEQGGIKHLRPQGDPSYYVMHILRMIGQLKQEYITADGLSLRIARQETELLGIEKIHQKGAHKGKVRSEYQKKEKAIEKNKELLFVYRAYESLLRDKKLYDFNDMIVETIHALESNEAMLRDLQEQYQYVLADEHQDVNGSQNKILELLCNFHDRPNIFVVGDEKQAIYRFQGASLENFLHFETAFRDTAIIPLASNYRSGQTILDVAHSLVAVEDGPLKNLRVPLVSETSTDARVNVSSYAHQGVEDVAVVEKIKTLLNNGVEASEVALIVRTNKDVELFTKYLRKENIPVSSSSETDVLSHQITTSILALIGVLSEPTNEQHLFTVLHGSYWGILPEDLLRVCAARTYARSLESVISDNAFLEGLGLTQSASVEAVSKVLEEARAKVLTHSPTQVLEHLLKTSGFLDAVTQENPIEGGAIVRQIYDQIDELLLQNKDTNLSALVRIFNQYKTYNIPLSVSAVQSGAQAVQVLTSHKSKGLEYAHVFIPHANDAVWGVKTTKTYFDIPLAQSVDGSVLHSLGESDDERRLLYVALTRAKETVTLSFAHKTAQDKTAVPSRFLEELDNSLLCVKEGESKEVDPLHFIGVTISSQRLPEGLLTTHLESRGLSATALNNYLESPWNYLYRNVLRIPEVQSESMLFGTIVHSVMERVLGSYRSEGTLAGATQLKTYLDQALTKIPLTNEGYARMHQKGFESLLVYVEHIKGNLPVSSREEFAMNVQLETGLPHFPILTLTGKLDRLDFDHNGNLLRVYDYKTGRPKTRNDIEGNTASSLGNYKRQLTFYALLLSLYGDERYESCRTGVLSFVEPDSKGKIHEEVFVITDEEIDELKAELIRVADEIVTGKFLSAPCDPARSNYCHLVSLLIGGE